jgi:hypothetical protein
MLVLLAREANVGVIIRRGPTKWWRLTLWDTWLDRFTAGQWFHGQMYPDQCDLSPDGKLFIYFAGKFRDREVVKGYGRTWTAVSRPPYLTALALWPMGNTWGGQGIFLDKSTVLLTTSSMSYGAKHHPDHPPGPLSVVEYHTLREDDPRRQALPSWRSGWEKARVGSLQKKTSGGLSIETARDVPDGHPSTYTLYQDEGKPLATFKANWADWDRQGRLVATIGGRVLGGKLSRGQGLVWRQLAAMNEEKPAAMETAEWAQRW